MFRKKEEFEEYLTYLADTPSEVEKILDMVNNAKAEDVLMLDLSKDKQVIFEKEGLILHHEKYIDYFVFKVKYNDLLFKSGVLKLYSKQEETPIDFSFYSLKEMFKLLKGFYKVKVKDINSLLESFYNYCELLA